MDVKIEGKKLIITLDLETPHQGNISGSGKTHVIAGSGGFVKTAAIEPTTKKQISVGVNCTIPAK